MEKFQCKNPFELVSKESNQTAYDQIMIALDIRGRY